MIDVVEAGFAPTLIPYLEGWELQKRIHSEVVRGERPETLILLEHESVFTAGSRTLDSERPAHSSIPVIDVDRGGKITWHGPGQLIGYPIMRVAERGDAVTLVRRIETLLIGVAEDLGIEATRIRGRSGVWTPDGAAKIAAIGMRVEKGVTMHGFALNCAGSLAAYDDIVACGITDAGVTTLSLLSGREISPAQVKDAVSGAFRNEMERIPA
ncbi:lipoyl(octanoyl) transferase LipB [Microbacterium amylolyticum]|uniref:Octanoyltransferase n=1 Tax=Microbacterium amylolyticum TaxID=936337 RepID=A0ABS4ZDT7_9MICO|nr:lipoyl(octanoyl) transferase LipB [Microbacterium amylolyticum]MBP2435449.1 lipoyl(octanoyl) transferase [Microbacterium amylolyticum]